MGPVDGWSSFLGSWWRLRASASRSSSWVLKVAQVFLVNAQNSAPMWCVVSSRIFRVSSVCIRSFANLCQWAQVKSSFRITLLCSSGSRLSKAGMAHWPCNQHVANICIHEMKYPQVINSQNHVQLSSSTLKHYFQSTWLYLNQSLVFAWSFKYRISLLSKIFLYRDYLAYWQYNSCRRALLWACKIQRRWINSDFQTPSSNSCKRSTTNIW